MLPVFWRTPKTLHVQRQRLSAHCTDLERVHPTDGGKLEAFAGLPGYSGPVPELLDLPEDCAGRVGRRSYSNNGTDDHRCTGESDTVKLEMLEGAGHGGPEFETVENVGIPREVRKETHVLK